MWVRAAPTLVILALLLGAPLALRPASVTQPDAPHRLIVISPHHEQIRQEISGAFSRWHERTHGERIQIDWRTPGGTSDIRALLTAQYTSAARDGRIAPNGRADSGAMPYDVMLGGGSYEHEQLKRGVEIALADGSRARIPISRPVDVDQETLDQWYGENRIGSSMLYDPDRHWLGTTLSSFGILYNADSLDDLGAAPPRRWRDLTHPSLAGWIALADPRMSGSVATAYDAILNNYGWDDGWRTLRAMAANARYFASYATRPVIDISAGEAALGLCIDFYGRYQAQAIGGASDGASRSRLGFVEPAGETLIDPDPVSILVGGPRPALAERFVRFLLSDEGQAVWQFRAVGVGAPAEALGPRRFELRRLPITRRLYRMHLDRFIDRVDPFEVASAAEPRGWRRMLGPLFGAFAIDSHSEMTEAWRAINAARDAGAARDVIAELEDRFFAMPIHRFADGRTAELTADTFDEIASDWADRARSDILRIEYTAWFRELYREVAQEARRAIAPSRVN